MRFLGNTHLERERELRVFTEYVGCGNIYTMVREIWQPSTCGHSKVHDSYLAWTSPPAWHGSCASGYQGGGGGGTLITKRGCCNLADVVCSGTLHEAEGREELRRSPHWMTPEIIHRSPPAMAGDMRAVGCVGSEMLQRPIWNVAGDLNPLHFYLPYLETG
ncbi:protein kinase [Trypanosoma rangeli]|uniref:Protein kinase n=1 Tax=Trypanosoma rangeli TaxID=5698 RepID=A0A422N2L4_TRYRA|nr:protein kinase [Trypanosoma rangeli]RNE99712.1 protein kinase [Trypanosoma rangeli]|eukprot:RNE99712.1 protein kinase [Trypanosoma rangeli]